MQDSHTNELGDVGDEAGEHEYKGTGSVGAHQHGLSAVGVGQVAPEGTGDAHEKSENAGRGAGPESCVCPGLDAQLLLDEEGIEGLHERPAYGGDTLG